MEPEELDVVELLEDVAVEPGWQVEPEVAPEKLLRGERGMVVHRYDQTPAFFDVEFIDLATQKPRALAKLRADQLRVVERMTLEEE